MKTGERKMKKTLSIVIIGILFISMFSIFAPKALGTASETSLQVAEKAATWTISQAISENGGYKWANYLQGGPRYVSTVPFGGSGFGTFYLKLYKQTGNTLYLDYAKGAAHWVISQAVSDSGGYKWPQPDDDIPSPGWWLSPMVSGIGDFLLSMYQTTGDITYREYAAGAARWLMAMAYWGEAGCFIPYNPPGPYGTQAAHGIAPGREAYTATFLLHMYQETKDTTYLPYIRGTAEWLISGPDKVVDANGYKWRFNRPYGSVYPPDGNGQIALFFYEIYEALGDPTYLQYAQGTINWLLSQAVINGNTAKWYDPVTGLYMTLPLSDMGGMQGFWGIPEPNCLLMAVYGITKNPTYLDYAKKLANWITSSDIAVSEGGGYKFPNYQGSSFYSAYQNAKIYNFLSWLSSLTGETTYSNYADGALQWIIFSATESNGGYAWRTIPYFPYNAAWFESGAAGVGYYLASAATIDRSLPFDSPSVWFGPDFSDSDPGNLADEGFKTVWFSIPDTDRLLDPDYSSGIKSFIEQAHRRGLFVHAMILEERSIDIPNGPFIEEKVNGVVQFNLENPTGKFDGIHIDVEPHASPEWNSRNDQEQNEIVTDYLGLLSQIHQKLQGTGLAFSAAHPYWYQEEADANRLPAAQTSNFGEFLDAIVLMVYGSDPNTNPWDTVPEISAKVIDEITVADSCSRLKIIVGMGVQEFWKHEELTDCMMQLDLSLRTHKSYGGLSIFNYAQFLESKSWEYRIAFRGKTQEKYVLMVDTANKRFEFLTPENRFAARTATVMYTLSISLWSTETIIKQSDEEIGLLADILDSFWIRACGVTVNEIETDKTDSPSDSFPRWSVFFVKGASPVNILVTAPDGLRVGFDPGTGEIVQEIQGAEYSGPATEPQTIIIPNPTIGTYDVILVGTATGNYTLTLEHANSTISQRQIFNGTVMPDETRYYSATLSEVSRMTSISWEHVFKDAKRGMMLKISIDDKYFQFIAPNKDFGIKHDPNMISYRNVIAIYYKDSEILMTAIAATGKIVGCTATLLDRQTRKLYWLFTIQKALPC